ncbi:AAA family ATPase, partial [Deinococcus pimensis]|uniref:AAA family ATPase n=1 Tax=Deinococcus pimensis TaxID=309888 RepID=UPI000482CDEB
MKTVYVLVGIPGSGKSTVADALRGRAARRPGRTLTVGSDALRAELTGSETERSMNDLVWEVFFDRVAGA